MALTVIAVVITAITLFREAQGVPYKEAFMQNISFITIAGGILTLAAIPMLWICSRSLLRLVYRSTTVDKTT